MSEEAGFLEALAHTPDNNTTRLVYADWLADRGDPRAEFLRIDHRLMSEQPAFLRRRFIELQATLDPQWAMRVASRHVPLAELRVVLPPPPRRFHPNGSWGVVEAAIGTRLPADYKAFLDVYGRGSVGHLNIDHPFSIIGNVHEEWARWAATWFADLIGDLRGAPPLFPEPGGLLPFGTIGDVGLVGWLTEGEPEDWSVLYHGRDEGLVELKGLSVADSVLALVAPGSPLLVRLGYETAFKAPNYFEPDWPGSRSLEFTHPDEVDLDALVAALAPRWPSEEVRVIRTPGWVRVLSGPLRGRVAAHHEGGRTWLLLSYGPDGAREAALVEADLRAEGFGEIG
jgi:uncharacterized protein (TIGR02996 family)